MATYDERRAARQDRLDNRAENLTAEMERRVNAAHRATAGIFFGQPILVGHHSEGRHRAASARSDANMRKACEAQKALEHVPSEATTAILAGDDDATDKLAERIAELERDHARMTAANKLARKGDAAGLATMGYSETVIQNLLHPRYAYLKAGFEPWQLSNNSANIRRLKIRLANLTEAKAKPSTEREAAGVRIVEDTEAMRLRLIFPGKPAPAVIAELKASGFRWAPSEGAWQANLHNRSRWAPARITATLPAEAAVA